MPFGKLRLVIVQTLYVTCFSPTSVRRKIRGVCVTAQAEAQIAAVAIAMQAPANELAHGCDLRVAACHSVDTGCSCDAGLCHFKARRPDATFGAGPVCGVQKTLNFVTGLWRPFCRKTSQQNYPVCDNPPFAATPCSRPLRCRTRAIRQNASATGA